MKRKYQTVISVILIIIAAVALVIFGLCNFAYTQDEILNSLLNGIISRFIASAALLAVMIILGIRNIFVPDFKSMPKHLLWCIPCILVVLANFPFTALASGSASITHTQLIPLFILECLLIGLMEELLFRGLVQDTVCQLFENKAYKHIWTVLITSVIFAIVHLFNLFSGANIAATFLQAGYSFLIGAMLSAVLIKTNNLWLCVILHAAFDVGGNIITELGTGAFQDMWFWIFTAVAGVICLLHILFYLLKIDKVISK